MYSIVASRSLALASAALECWPHGTIHTRDDAIVNGCSCVRAAEAEHTPAVRIGAAGGPWKMQAAAPHRFITVLLTRVEHVDRTGRSHRPQIWVDAELERCHPILSAARLLGREGAARHKRMQLHSQSSDDAIGGWIRLPADIAAGDLIALPCDGASPIGDVLGASHRAQIGEEHREDSDDDLPIWPSCLK